MGWFAALEPYIKMAASAASQGKGRRGGGDTGQPSPPVPPQAPNGGDFAGPPNEIGDLAGLYALLAGPAQSVAGPVGQAMPGMQVFGQQGTARPMGTGSFRGPPNEIGDTTTQPMSYIQLLAKYGDQAARDRWVSGTRPAVPASPNEQAIRLQQYLQSKQRAQQLPGPPNEIGDSDPGSIGALRGQWEQGWRPTEGVEGAMPQYPLGAPPSTNPWQAMQKNLAFTASTARGASARSAKGAQAFLTAMQEIQKPKREEQMFQWVTDALARIQKQANQANPANPQPYRGTLEGGWPMGPGQDAPNVSGVIPPSSGGMARRIGQPPAPDTLSGGMNVGFGLPGPTNEIGDTPPGWQTPEQQQATDALLNAMQAAHPEQGQELPDTSVEGRITGKRPPSYTIRPDTPVNQPMNPTFGVRPPGFENLSDPLARNLFEAQSIIERGQLFRQAIKAGQPHTTENVMMVLGRKPGSVDAKSQGREFAYNNALKDITELHARGLSHLVPAYMQDLTPEQKQELLQQHVNMMQEGTRVQQAMAAPFTALYQNVQQRQGPQAMSQYLSPEQEMVLRGAFPEKGAGERGGAPGRVDISKQVPPTREKIDERTQAALWGPGGANLLNAYAAMGAKPEAIDAFLQAQLARQQFEFQKTQWEGMGQPKTIPREPQPGGTPGAPPGTPGVTPGPAPATTATSPVPKRVAGRPGPPSPVDIMNYKARAQQIARSLGLDESYALALFQHENRWWDPSLDNQGPLGAHAGMGLGQVVPSTYNAVAAKILANWKGPAPAPDLSNPYNPEANMLVALTHFKGLVDRYNGDYRRAFAAYQAGQGNVSTNPNVPIPDRLVIAKQTIHPAVYADQAMAKGNGFRNGTPEEPWTHPQVDKAALTAQNQQARNGVPGAKSTWQPPSEYLDLPTGETQVEQSLLGQKRTFDYRADNARRAAGNIQSALQDGTVDDAMKEWRFIDKNHIQVDPQVRKDLDEKLFLKAYTEAAARIGQSGAPDDVVVQRAKTAAAQRLAGVVSPATLKELQAMEDPAARAGAIKGAEQHAVTEEYVSGPQAEQKRKIEATEAGNKRYQELVAEYQAKGALPRGAPVEQAVPAAEQRAQTQAQKTAMKEQLGKAIATATTQHTSLTESLARLKEQYEKAAVQGPWWKRYPTAAAQQAAAAAGVQNETDKYNVMAQDVLSQLGNLGGEGYKPDAASLKSLQDIPGPGRPRSFATWTAMIAHRMDDHLVGLHDAFEGVDNPEAPSRNRAAREDLRQRLKAWEAGGRQGERPTPENKPAANAPAATPSPTMTPTTETPEQKAARQRLTLGIKPKGQ